MAEATKPKIKAAITRLFMFLFILFTSALISSRAAGSKRHLDVRCNKAFQKLKQLFKTERLEVFCA